MQKNFMTWYAFKHYELGDSFVTVSKWNAIHGKQVKRREIIKYLESFYGKIGETPKQCFKKINNKVLVILQNGKIKQFRLLKISNLDIIKVVDNPFAEYPKLVEQKPSDNKKLPEGEEPDFVEWSWKRQFEKSFEKLNNPCAWYYTDGEYYYFGKNPNVAYQNPDPEKLERAKSFIATCMNRKFGNYLKDMWHKNCLDKVKEFKDNQDILPEIAWVLCDDDEYSFNLVFQVFEYDELVKSEKHHRYLDKKYKNSGICTVEGSAFYGTSWN